MDAVAPPDDETERRITAEQLTPEHFLPHVDKTFRVSGGRYVLTLSQVETRRLDEREVKAGLRQPFNLIVQGPPADLLPEGLYTFEVEGGSPFELYVMPIHTPTPGRQDYQAPFN